MNSTIDQAYIARVVRQVIARLKQPGMPLGTGTPQGTGTTLPAATRTNQTAASISDKIVTANLVEQLAGKPSQVFVGSKAIITPAAKDVAKQRGITITRSVELPKSQIPAQVSANTTSSASTNTTASPVTTSRGKTSSTTTQNITDTQDPGRAIAVAQQLSRRGIQSGSAQIVLSDTPAADVFRLCSGGQRAAMVGSTNDVSRFANELQPTVWVIDMKQMNLIAAVNAAAQIAKL